MCFYIHDKKNTHFVHDDGFDKHFIMYFTFSRFFFCTQFFMSKEQSKFPRLFKDTKLKKNLYLHIFFCYISIDKKNEK